MSHFWKVCNSVNKKMEKCSRIPRDYALWDSYVKFHMMVSAHR